MKVSNKDQQVINAFMRDYVDSSYNVPMNAVRLNVDHTPQHRETIFRVCEALLTMGVPFFTEVRLKCGCIPDVVCPTYDVAPFIEVLSSETLEMFEELKLHKYPVEYQDRFKSGRLKSFIFVDANEEFSERCLM